MKSVRSYQPHYTDRWDLLSNTAGTEKLQQASEEAADLLLHLMRHAESESVRLEAAKSILNTGELAARMSRLEESVREATEPGSPRGLLPGAAHLSPGKRRCVARNSRRH